MKRTPKIARGYRLYPKTLKMIEKIQRILQADSDKAIFTACSHYLNSQKNKNPEKSLTTNL